ncbi:MAG: hypothetical protein QXU18_08115 [Thermoplasmatales archaeon]
MSAEDKYFSFKEEFIEVVESFGYHNTMKGKIIRLAHRTALLFHA